MYLDLKTHFSSPLLATTELTMYSKDVTVPIEQSAFLISETDFRYGMSNLSTVKLQETIQIDAPVSSAIAHLIQSIFRPYVFIRVSGLFSFSVVFGIIRAVESAQALP